MAQYFRTANGFRCESQYRAKADYRGTSPATVVGGTYENRHQESEVWTFESTAKLVTLGREHDGKKMAGINKALARVQQAKLVVEEEARQFNLPRELVQDANSALKKLERWLEGERTETQTKVASRTFFLIDQVKADLDRLTEKLKTVSAEHAESAARVREMVSTTYRYSLFGFLGSSRQEKALEK